MFSQVLMLVMLAQAASTTGETVCELLSGSTFAAIPAPFQPVAQLAKEGNPGAALDRFLVVAQELDKEAEKLFFSGESPDLGALRQYLEVNTVSKPASLHVRKDRFALAAEMSGWGAYLACQAGKYETGMMMLKSGWRDWASRLLITDAAFLSLAHGKISAAIEYLPDVPETARQKAAAGLLACRRGDQKAGGILLQKAWDATTDNTFRKQIDAVRAECK